MLRPTYIRRLLEARDGPEGRAGAAHWSRPGNPLGGGTGFPARAGGIFFTAQRRDQVISMLLLTALK
jgi:hypothetical protein